MDPLITLHRGLQKVVDLVGLRPLAQKVFRRLYARRFSGGKLARAIQNGREWWLTPEVALRGEWAEFETIEWLREVVRPGMTVFDIGANVGQMTLEMAHLVGPTGRVIAIEPAPGNLRVLREHLDANGFSDRVTVLEAACSEVGGQEVEFVIFGQETDAVGSGHQMRSASADSPSQNHVVIRTRTVTVDGICQELGLKPAVLKIDVEGAEASVLLGAKTTLQSAGPTLRFGFHPFAFSDPAGSAGQIQHFLDTINYVPAAGALPPTQWTLAEYVFSPKSRTA